MLGDLTIGCAEGGRNRVSDWTTNRKIDISRCSPFGDLCCKLNGSGLARLYYYCESLRSLLHMRHIVKGRSVV